MSSREMLFETRFEGALRHRADDLVDELAVLEEEQRRDPHDHELLRDPRVLVRVELHERHLARVGLRQPVDHRGNRAAGRAPLGPAVDEDVRGLYVLDLGCGNGYLSRRFAQAGAKVVAVDASAPVIERARARESQEPLGIEYHVADAARLEFLRAGTLDLVASHMALMDI